MTSSIDFAKLEQIARTCHEVNRAYCIGIGDNTQKPWAETHPDIQASARNGVMHLVMNPNATPEQSHENWVEFKRAYGWTWGPRKDEARRTHPCMMPYDQLPPAQKAKDLMFHAVVRAQLADVNPQSASLVGVFDVLAGERRYQDDQKADDDTWRDGQKVEQTPGQFQNYMDIYLGHARRAEHLGDTNAQLHSIRKVAALGVACLQKFGAPRREGY